MNGVKEDTTMANNAAEPSETASSSVGEEVNISQWIANAIADTGTTVVYGKFGLSWLLA